MLKLSALVVALSGATFLISDPAPESAATLAQPTATRSSRATVEPALVAPRQRPAPDTPESPDIGLRGAALDDGSGVESRRDVAVSTLVLGIRVVDPAGAPIAEALVDLSGVRLVEKPDSIYGWRAGTVAPGETDADGFTHLAVPASWNGMTPEAISFTVDHGDFVPFCSDLVPLAEGRTTVELEWGAFLAVSGWIGDPERGRVATVLPTLGIQSGAPMSDWFELGDGRLATNGLAAGAHNLVLTHVAADGRRFRSAITPIDLEAGGRRDLSVELVPVAQVRGVLSSDVPRPVVNGEVIAHQSGGEKRVYARDWRVAVAEDGTFVIDDVGPGVVEVGVLVDGWASVDYEVVPDAAGGDRVDGFRNPAVEVAATDVRLDVGMVRTAMVELDVVGPDGEAVTDAMLGVRNTVHWHSGRWQYFDRSSWAKTDASGLGRLLDVRPGDQWLSLYHPDYRIAGPYPAVSEGDLPGGPVAAGERRRVSLELVAVDPSQVDSW